MKNLTISRFTFYVSRFTFYVSRFPLMILGLLMLLTASGIGYALMVEMSLEDLTRGASHVVIGTVDDVKASSDNEGMIYTFVHLSIEEVLKGHLEHKRVVVRVAGGQIGDLSVQVEDQPKFEQGQKVLIFLIRHRSDDSFFEVYGLVQGVLHPTAEWIERVRGLIAAFSNDYFPMRKGKTWSYHSEPGETRMKAVDRIADVMREGEHVVYIFESYNSFPRAFVKAGRDQVVEVIKEGARRLWYDFSAPVGESWTIEPFAEFEGSNPIDGTVVTVAGKGETIETPLGVFENCIHFSFSNPHLADAGLMHEWFAPGVGCVERVVQSIAGPITYELVHVSTPRSAPFLEVTTDKKQYEEGEDIKIIITVTNNGEEEIALDFPTGLQADYVIDGWVRWSKGRMFTMALTSVTLPVGESHTWEFIHTSEDARLKPGIHTIVGFLTGSDPVYGSFWRLEATTDIIVGTLGKIEGVVVDEDGDPLPDVYLRAYRKLDLLDASGSIFSEGNLVPDPEEARADTPFMPTEPHFARTDETGKFAFEYLPVGETFLISAFKEDYELLWTEVELSSETVSVELTLSKMALGTLAGRVLDQNGDSVPEAHIRATAYPDFGWLDLFLDRPLADEEKLPLSDYVHMVEALFRSMEPWRSAVEPWMPLSRSFSASTDPNGDFVVEGIPIGWSLSIHVAKKGYESAFAEVEMTSEPDDVNLTMTKLRFGRIRGIVMDKEDGAPIPEAYIVAYPKGDDWESPSDEEVSWSRETESDSIPITDSAGQERAPDPTGDYPDLTGWGVYHSVTDENGEFVLDEVNLDWSWVVWAYREGYDPAGVETETASDAPYVEIALTETEMGVLTGIVMNDAGEVVPGAEVLAYPEIYPLIPEMDVAIAQPRGPFKEYTATTDAEGQFVIEPIPVGRTIGISARKQGYEVAHRRIERTEKETFVQLYLIALEEDYPNRNADLRDGMRYEVAMDRMAYNTEETAKLHYRVMNLAEEIKTFSFPTSQRVEFLVLSPDSSVGNWEWPGKVIWRWSEGQEFESSPGEITLAQGESLVLEGTLDLSALPSEERGFLLIGFLAGMPEDTHIYTKFMIEREVPIEAQVTITGVVMDERGQPLPHANVAARPATVLLKSQHPDLDDERYIAVTDEKGHFVLRGLYRGSTYEVTVFVEGYAPRQEIVYAIREQNAVRFVLHEEASGDRLANVSYFVHDGLQIALATDRHFYPRDGVIRMSYRLTNTQEAPIALRFSGGQQVDFVLKQGEKVLWRWSDGRAFIEAETTLELPAGASAAFKAELALASLDAVRGTLTLSGYLTPSEGSERTRGSLELTVGEEHAVVDVDAEDAAGGPIQVDSRMGMVVELVAPSGIKGQIEFSEAPRNTPEELAGHRFLRIVDFRPDPVLSAFVERIYVEIEYDEAQLNALGIESEEAVQVFYWDASSDPPKWRSAEGGVDTERNVAWGNVPVIGTQWGLFAAEPLAVGEETDATPTAFALAQNVPNPFNPSTIIRFSIPNIHRDAQVTLAIYNALGQRVRTLVDRTMKAGVHSVVWDGRDEQGRMVSSGVYLYRLTAGGRIQTRKMLLIK